VKPYGLTIPNLVGFWDFSRVPEDVGDILSGIQDLYGSRHLAQSVESRRPSVVWKNGRKAGNFISANSQFLVGSGFPDLNLPVTVFAVVGGTGGTRYFTLGGTNVRAGGGSNFAGSSLGSNIVTSTSLVQVTSVFDGANSKIRRNGSQIFAGTTGTQEPGTVVAIGAQADAVQPWNGTIGEVLLVAGVPSDELIAEIEAAQGAKWGLGYGSPVPLVGETSENMVAQHAPWLTLENGSYNQELDDYLRCAGSMFEQIELYGFDTEDFEGWSILLDVDRCPAEALPYLAQYVGERLPAGLLEEEMRQWVRDAPNQRRGTLPALVDAAQRYLTGGKNVTVIQRDAGHPDHVTVVTYTDQTPNSAQVLAEIMSVFPAELTLTYVVSSGQIWSQVIATDADWTNSMAESATWADLMAETPSGTYG